MLKFFIAPTNMLCAPHRADTFCDVELKRLATIKASKRRDEYIAGHYLLRMAASHLLEVDSQYLGWRQPQDSAPQLTLYPQIKFGLSHSAGWVAAIAEIIDDCASAQAKVGLDIECERSRKNLHQLARYSFTEDWLNLHRENLLPAFFQRWTLCEALVKGSEKTLGTELLRNQRFDNESTTSANFWLYHARLGTEDKTQLSFLPHPALHISMCSSVHHKTINIQGFALKNEHLVPIEKFDFSVFCTTSN